MTPQVLLEIRDDRMVMSLDRRALVIPRVHPFWWDGETLCVKPLPNAETTSVDLYDGSGRKAGPDQMAHLVVALKARMHDLIAERRLKLRPVVEVAGIDQLATHLGGHERRVFTAAVEAAGARLCRFAE